MSDGFTREGDVEKTFEVLLRQLQEWRPSDRSARDRYCAITITEVEKAKALFLTYCAKEQP